MNAAIDTHGANAIRMLAVDAVQQATSGHPGMPMSMADIATVLCPIGQVCGCQRM
jgi:transketolase